MRVLALIAFALAAANVLLVAYLIGRGLWLERADRRRRAASERMRPAVLSLIDGDAAAGEGLKGKDAEVFAALLGRYAVALRGEAQSRITRWFEAHGAVARELDHLRDRRAWRRAQAAFTLGDIGSSTAVPALVAALQDRSGDVRAAATRSLGHLHANDAIEAVIEAATDRRVPRSVVTAAALELGTAVVPHLEPLLDHERPAVRSAAVELYGLLETSGDARPLVESLRDPSAVVRSAAALGLQRVADASAVEALVETLADREETVRTAAADALGAIGADGAVEALLRVAREDNFEPARAAAHAAARIDPGRVQAEANVTGTGQFLAEAADLAAL